MQYTEIFSAVKIENFTRKKFDSFNIFAQNIDCGYTLEPPRQVGFKGVYITRTCFPDVSVTSCLSVVTSWLSVNVCCPSVSCHVSQLSVGDMS